MTLLNNQTEHEVYANALTKVVSLASLTVQRQRAVRSLGHVFQVL
jgi:hypothetical protein